MMVNWVDIGCYSMSCPIDETITFGALGKNFEHGIFNGIEYYDHRKTLANTGLLPLVYN